MDQRRSFDDAPVWVPQLRTSPAKATQLRTSPAKAKGPDPRAHSVCFEDRVNTPQARRRSVGGAPAEQHGAPSEASTVWKVLGADREQVRVRTFAIEEPARPESLEVSALDHFKTPQLLPRALAGTDTPVCRFHSAKVPNSAKVPSRVQVPGSGKRVASPPARLGAAGSPTRRMTYRTTKLADTYRYPTVNVTRVYHREPDASHDVPNYKARGYVPLPD